MSTHHRIQRRTDRHTAARAANIDPRQPRVMDGQFIHEDHLRALLEAVGAAFEDSKLQEVVNPATGHFWHITGISAAGGTDDTTGSPFP